MLQRYEAYTTCTTTNSLAGQQTVDHALEVERGAYVVVPHDITLAVEQDVKWYAAAPISQEGFLLKLLARPKLWPRVLMRRYA